MLTERVNVRMSRGSSDTAWGFQLTGGRDYGSAVSVGQVTSGGLADRAGLQHRDHVVELCGRRTDNMSHSEGDNLIRSSGNSIDLVVERGASRSWHTTIPAIESEVPHRYTTTQQSRSHVSRTDDTHHSGYGQHGHHGGFVGTEFKSRHEPQSNRSFYETSKHQTYSSTTGGGHGAHHSPGGGGGGADHQRFLHLQYNSPAPLYSKQNINETISQQTTGHTTDSKDSKFLQSETLKLIKETEGVSRGDDSYKGTLHHTTADEQSGSFRRLTHALDADADGPAAVPHHGGGCGGGAPVCDGCGRDIVGVFCKAADQLLHDTCFCCTTCGCSLKNVGFIKAGNKLYCDIHGRHHHGHQQYSRQSSETTGASAFSQVHIVPEQKTHEPDIPKAFYHPDILGRSNVHVSTKVISPFGAEERGVPTAAYGGAGSLSTKKDYHYSKSTTETMKSGSTHAPFSASAHSPSHQTSGYKPVQPPSFTPGTPFSGHASGIGTTSHAASNISSSLTSKTITGSSSHGAAPPPHIGPHLSGKPREPKRGKGILQALGSLPRVPFCESCNREIRGPFVLAMQKTWCPDHFICGNSNCGRKLLDIGFVEEHGQIYCEFCFEKYFAPSCSKCSRAIMGDCVNAMQKHWHPECFVCAHCHQPFGTSSFFIEEGKPYCEKDWNQMYTTKCIGCDFPIEPGDRWVEALGGAYHSNCFTCSFCQKELEGQSFFAKGGKPYCKAHA